MARRNVLQEIPISVPQTEQQSYEIVTVEEDSLPYIKPIPSAQRPHSRYISNDESKENITPSQLENSYQEKSPVKILDGGSVGDEPGASSSSPASSVNVLTPKRSEGAPDDLQPCNAPMDFSTVTVEDLDITSESFTTKCAGKSPKSLNKHRRRSTIGVRGSPEMNFLIRQIALQRSNRKTDPEPEGNPFSSPRNSLLREKIAAFRNAFQAVEETEGKLSFPGFSEVEELKSGRGEGTSGPPEKRKKICDPSDLGVPSELERPSAASCPAPPLEKPLPEKTLESDCTLASRPLAEVPSKSVEVLTDDPQMLPDTSRSRKRKVVFAGVSPPEPEQSLPLITEASYGPVLKPALKKTPRRDFLHFRLRFPEEDGDLFSLHEAADDDDDDDKPVDSVKMKKRVTFGRELSPEIFDKTLPANTPIRRGSTPYNYRKLDATPSAEQSVCESPSAYAPVPQPDFDEEEETLQPVSLCFDAASSDSDSPASSSLPEHSEEGEISAAADIINESFITLPEVSPAETTRQTRSRQKLTSGKTTPERIGLKPKVKSNAKKPKKSVIGKKVQIKVSRGKGKKKGRKSKKSVQKPVHGEREVVSRKPVLSPIPELPECIPTPPASTSQGFLYVGKTFHEHPMKKVHTEVLENNIPFTLEDTLEKSFEEKDPERPSLCAVEDVQTQDATTDPALVVDVNVSNGSPEKSEEVLGLVPQVDLVSGECPQSSTAMDVIDQLTKPATSVLSSSSVEKISKTRSTKRRSSTRRSVSHASVNSENTVDCVKQDEGTLHSSPKPETSIDNPALGAVELSSIPNELAEESSTTSYSKPPLSSITTEHKKSRRSSRIHQVSNILSSNLEQKEQTTPGEHTAAIPPHPVDSFMNDFCLPIDEALHFPQPEKKVRRSMRLRRDSGVIGLSWVQENDVSETTGRRKSVSSVTRLEESSALFSENAAHSPNKENLSSYHVANPPRRARRRTLCTTIFQESVSTCDKKRRKSNAFYKAPNTMPTSDEADHNTLVPDA